jgi:nucleoside-diphosphate-sugar epimerase
MRVAITGANGFIGRHLVRRFGEAGWNVKPVVRRDYESNRIEERFAGVDVVVHAAGATRAPSRARLRASNVGLTAATLAAAARADVRRFVFISSQAAAGPARALGAPVAESDVATPVEAYGRSKLDAEELVRASELPWVVVRPAAVYGPHDRDFLAMHRFAARGIAIHPGNREQWISIIHVDDVAQGVLAAALDGCAVTETFFLANDAPVQWSTLFRTVADCAGRTLRVDAQLPSALVEIGARVGDVVAKVTGHASLLTADKAKLAKAPFWVCSNARATEMLGVSPSVELQRGLCDTYHWYRTQGWI